MGLQPVTGYLNPEKCIPYQSNNDYSFVIKKSHVICAYLGFNTVVIQRQLVGIPLIMEMEGMKYICIWFYTLH
jgi:hypothetical protein